MAEVTTKWTVSVWSAAGEFDSETWFTDKQKALDAAKAIASPGSLSAEPGDKVHVDEHAITELLVLTKPEVQ